MTAGLNYWGPMFPDAAHNGPCFWGPDFPDCTPNPAVVVGVGPSTVATLGLTFLAGYRVRFSWGTDITKTYGGLESRAQPDDLPRLTFNGKAHLPYADVLVDRGALARYAAQGKPFLLGLPNEALPITAIAGAVVSTTTTTLADWAVLGQRVVLLSSDFTASAVGVIQSVASSSFTLDISPAVGFVFGTIMPGVPVLLDPQSEFERSQAIGSLETWQLSGRSVMFGYESGANIVAKLALSGVTAGWLTNATLVFTTPGTIGNGASLTLAADGAGAGSSTFVGQAMTFHFQAGATTIAQLLAALTASGLFQLVGPLPPLSTTLRNPQEVFTATLAGGTDKSWGTMGVGASVTTYLGAPIWDRALELGGADSIHTMTELLDLGGVPQQFQTASVPDWGRAVNFSRLSPSEWQWWKAFMLACLGRQVAFWLPSWRADLSPVTNGLTPGTLKVSSTVGDFLAWWATQRQYVQIVTPDGAVQYAQITNQVDNGDGTRSLSITSSNAAYNGGGGGATVTPTLVSWLDLCRWESDDFEVTWSDGARFAFQAVAHAVQR